MAPSPTTTGTLNSVIAKRTIQSMRAWTPWVQTHSLLLSVTMDRLFHLSADSQFPCLSNGAHVQVPRRGVCEDEMS